MRISDRLTQERLLEILTEAYKEGQENESIKVDDLLDEMKKKVLATVNTNNKEYFRVKKL